MPDTADPPPHGGTHRVPGSAGARAEDRTAAPPPMRLPLCQDEPEFGTLSELRRRFGIPRSTAYRLAARGLIRLVRVGRRRLVDFRSVRALLGTR